LDLRTLEKRWLQKWDEMQSIKHRTITLAAPFLSVDIRPVPPPYIEPKVILYVGKATHQDWWLDRFLSARNWSIANRIRERKLTTMWFLDEYPQNQNSAFWQFSRALSESVDAKIVWTNIAKIGVKRPSDEKKTINPFQEFLEAQKDLAVETLFAEISEYEPDLVVLVTGGDRPYRQLCMDAFHGWGNWTECSVNDDSVQFIRRSGAHPPVLLVSHPAIKATSEIAGWVAKARQLLAGSRKPSKESKKDSHQGAKVQ
jgi:hypothetical protein